MSTLIDRQKLRIDLCEILKSDYIALLGQRGSGNKKLVELILSKESPLPGMQFVAVSLPQGEQDSNLFMKGFFNNLVNASTQISPQPQLASKVNHIIDKDVNLPIMSRLRILLDIIGRYSDTNYLVIVLHDLAYVLEQPLKDLLLLLRE